jgi:IclR family pca regulon transcriptional regulator
VSVVSHTSRHSAASLRETIGELEEGLRSVAVPVRERTGRTVAAVDTAMHSGRRTAEECRTVVLPELRATAARIEEDLAVAGRFTRTAVS